MPIVRKLTSEEVRSIENRGKGLRKLIEEEYDMFLSDYSVGDYGEAELNEGEKRLTVRNRLKAAARRRNLVIDFKRTQGSILRFRISAEAPDASSSEAKEKGKARSRKKTS
jgi:hypothetical protein